MKVSVTKESTSSELVTDRLPSSQVGQSWLSQRDAGSRMTNGGGGKRPLPQVITWGLIVGIVKSVFRFECHLYAVLNKDYHRETTVYCATGFL